MARLFGGWPWELDSLPWREYYDLVRYLNDTKTPPDDDDGTEDAPPGDVVNG